MSADKVKSEIKKFLGDEETDWTAPGESMDTRVTFHLPFPVETACPQVHNH